jgi:hypothetical protein
MGGLFGSKPSVQPIAATPEQAPQESEASAVLEEFTDEEAEKKKRETKTQGTSALQIPLGTTTGGSTVGVV